MFILWRQNRVGQIGYHIHDELLDVGHIITRSIVATTRKTVLKIHLAQRSARYCMGYGMPANRRRRHRTPIVGQFA